MTFSVKSLLLTLSALFLFAAPARAADEQSLAQIVERYYALEDGVEQGGAATIEAILDLMHADMRYQHPEFGVNYDQAGLKDGYERRIARGWIRNNKTIITNMIVGKNMIALERSSTWEDRRTGSWEKRSSEGLVATFEFKDGKIWRVREFWE